MDISIQEPLNQGLLFYGKITTLRDSVNKKKIGEEFVEKGKLFFNYISIRKPDVEYYSQNSNKIDLKVKTYYVDSVDKKIHKVKISDIIYNITDVDIDNKKKYMYWYLSMTEIGD